MKILSQSSDVSDNACVAERLCKCPIFLVSDPFKVYFGLFDVTNEAEERHLQDERRHLIVKERNGVIRAAL